MSKLILRPIALLVSIAFVMLPAQGFNQVNPAFIKFEKMIERSN